MPVNAAGMAATLNVFNSEGHIFLIKLTHPSFAPQRLALAMSDVVSTADGTGAQTYIAYPFEISLPSNGKGIPTGTIRISNVTRLVWGLIKDITEPPPQLAIYHVLESDVNTVQDQFGGLDVRRVTADMLALEAEFSSENYASEPYPSVRVIPPYCNWMLYTG